MGDRSKIEWTVRFSHRAKEVVSPESQVWCPMQVTDIRYMPFFNPAVRNGIDSVTRGLVQVVRVTTWPPATQIMAVCSPRITFHPECVSHGAMNKVDPEGIWRCLALGCDVGCFQLPYKDYLRSHKNIR